MSNFYIMFFVVFIIVYGLMAFYLLIQGVRDLSSNK
jgi:hypothetical protein